MKLSHPIEIDLVEFFLTGKFDYIVPGQDAEWILANFADPDDDSDMGRGFRIWRWGSIEFHFDHNKLFMIWCDGFRHVASSSSLKVRRGWLDRPTRLTLARVQHLLNNGSTSYRVVHNPVLQTTQVRILASNVELHFEAADMQRDASQPNKYRMVAFGLSHPDYRRP